MQTMKVTAQRGTEPAVEVDYDMAETLAELAEQFGEEIVFGHAKRSIVIALQGHMRSMMDKGKEEGKDPTTVANSITDSVRGWKPSQKKAPRSTGEKARDILNRLSPAEREELMREYRARGKKEAQAA